MHLIAIFILIARAKQLYLKVCLNLPGVGVNIYLIMDISLIISILALILSIILGIIRFLDYRRDRAIIVLKCEKGKNFIFADSFLPGFKKLEEGESTKYIVEQDKIPLNKIKYIIAVDTIDRIFKTKLKFKNS